MGKISKAKIKYLFPIVHFLSSFFYERSIFVFAPDKDIILSIAKNQIISDVGERVEGYILSKLFAAVMIVFLWKLIFYLAGNWKTRKNIRFFLGIWIAGLVGLLLLWPEPFNASADNWITYSYAIRFWPEYWHSAYTSCVYAGMLMVVPSPVFITVFQWIFAVFVLGYLYNRILDSPVLRGKGRYGVFLFFLMPGVYTLCTNAYRTELYALLCMFLISMTVMDILDQKKRGIPHLVGNILLCGLVGVWRTEGIILGLLLFALQLVFLYSFKPVKALLWFGCLLLVFGAFTLPQKLGDIKYYGKDYSFINSFPTLRNILASPAADLNYDGAEEDLAALEAVTPVEILRCYGMDGYRRYNYANGRGDINQSCADDETAAAYMRGYYRLVAHNLPIYARTQMFMLLKAIMIAPAEYVVGSDQPPVNDLPSWKLASWDIGRADLESRNGYAGWAENGFHKWFAGAALRVIDGFAAVLERIYFYSLILIVIPLFEIFLFFREGIRFLKKKSSLPGLAGVAFILLGQAAAICLVMPAGMLVYFHAYYYCSFVLCLVYFNCLRCRRENRQGKD